MKEEILFFVFGAHQKINGVIDLDILRQKFNFFFFFCIEEEKARKRGYGTEYLGINLKKI